MHTVRYASSYSPEGKEAHDAHFASCKSIVKAAESHTPSWTVEWLEHDPGCGPAQEARRWSPQGTAPSRLRNWSGRLSTQLGQLKDQVGAQLRPGADTVSTQIMGMFQRGQGHGDRSQLPLGSPAAGPPTAPPLAAGGQQTHQGCFHM